MQTGPCVFHQPAGWIEFVAGQELEREREREREREKERERERNTQGLLKLQLETGTTSLLNFID